MHEQGLSCKLFRPIYINLRSSKLFSLFLCFFLQFSGFSQSRVVIKDDAYVVLNTASTSESVFVVLDNGNTNALATSGEETSSLNTKKTKSNGILAPIQVITQSLLQPLQQQPMHPNLKFLLVLL